MKPWEDLSTTEKTLWVCKVIFCWPESEYKPFNELLEFGEHICDVFNPSEETDHDFLVLKHVREKWDHERTCAFVENLKTIRWPRCNVTSPFSLELFAEPGDYSHAAYLTLAVC